MLGDTFQRRFNLGLHKMTIEGTYNFNYSGVASYRECQYPLVRFVPALATLRNHGLVRADHIIHGFRTLPLGSKDRSPRVLHLPHRIATRSLTTSAHACRRISWTTSTLRSTSRRTGRRTCPSCSGPPSHPRRECLSSAPSSWCVPALLLALPKYLKRRLFTETMFAPHGLTSLSIVIVCQVVDHSIPTLLPSPGPVSTPYVLSLPSSPPSLPACLPACRA